MNFEEEEKLRGKPLSVDVCLEVFYSLTRSLKLGPCNLCVYLFHTALSKSTKGQDLSGWYQPHENSFNRALRLESYLSSNR